MGESFNDWSARNLWWLAPIGLLAAIVNLILAWIN